MHEVAACRILLALAPMLCQAQENAYPHKAVRVVVPNAACRAADVLDRKIADKLAARLKQAVYIDNPPGSHTVITSEHVASALPDGYTLFSTNATLLDVPFLTPTKFDALRDFTPIARYCSASLLLSVPASLPVNNVKKLIAYVKARPDHTSYSWRHA